ncbi:exodeoxyribonuclease VII small subunit [Pigmentibacter sp. JX0631]|uniref:exodeoxyribonuclease VII small subunit n=1 Tax=Pigmentibacter sp. JX0631 TaxID=2976982 RepID=UPI00246873FF|nr:exodeoxyribonuclease VII small subunit [Pigmentibacter sp. JX0631]WGL60294.1 exodeoxyribonuclease VII small subunit [Pigmentibacter sp. JX0631]
MENQSYPVLLKQVNDILMKMENETIPIDELSQKLTEAYNLIEKLKSQLFSAEIQIEQIINSRNLNLNSSEENNGSQ